MKFVWYFHIHHINILHELVWNHSLDNKVMKLYLTVCRRVRSKSKFLEQNSSSPSINVNSIKFRSCISHNVLPPQ